jgi:hypothetical protein
MCERCKQFEDHIADLRNKYGSIHTYFQLKEEIEVFGVVDDQLDDLFIESEAGIISANDKFRQLLVKDI